MVFSFFASKKAQGMSMNIVVIAVICIVILVVLLVIMSGKTSMFSKTAGSCEQKGPGAGCIAEADEQNCGGTVYKFGTDCPKKDENKPWCCVPI